MPDQEPCFLCGTTHEAALRDHLFIHQKCPRCGEFKLTAGACRFIQKSNDAIRVKISGWVSDQNRTGVVPEISADVLKQVSARPLPTIVERADRLLLEALREQDRLTWDFDIDQPRYLAATYSKGIDDVTYLAEMLVDEGLVKLFARDGIYRILPHGHIAADKLIYRTAPGDKGFVAMWLDEDLKSAYEKGFQVGILNAGYDPVRVDRVEHTNRIDDEIIAHIRTASFVVADFTGHRGGVYFEAGFALGLDLPVIWTCRKGDMEDLHFDIRQYNTIGWETPEELATRLQRRIEASVGKGPKTVLDS